MMSNTFNWCNSKVPLAVLNHEGQEIQGLIDLMEERGWLTSHRMGEIPKNIMNKLSIDQTKAMMVYPLLIKKETKGFIYFEGWSQDRLWREEEVEILKTLTHFIENAY